MSRMLNFSCLIKVFRLGNSSFYGSGAISIKTFLPFLKMSFEDERKTWNFTSTSSVEDQASTGE